MKLPRVSIILSLGLLWGSAGPAATLPVCEEGPAFADGRLFDAIDLPHLPTQVLVARSVELWATNKAKGFKILARQDFKSMKGEVRCSKAPEEGTADLTSWVPTLLDLSPEKKMGGLGLAGARY